MNGVNSGLKLFFDRRSGRAADDLEARRLTIDTLGLRSEIPYDSLILAAGADQSSSSS